MPLLTKRLNRMAELTDQSAGARDGQTEQRIEAEGNYVALWVKGRAHLVRETMKGIETKLDPARFVRVHRSAIVCVDHIRRLEPWAHGEYVVTMSDGSKLTSSRTHGTRLQELLR